MDSFYQDTEGIWHKQFFNHTHGADGKFASGRGGGIGQGTAATSKATGRKDVGNVATDFKNSVAHINHQHDRGTSHEEIARQTGKSLGYIRGVTTAHDKAKGVTGATPGGGSGKPAPKPVAKAEPPKAAAPKEGEAPKHAIPEGALAMPGSGAKLTKETADRLNGMKGKLITAVTNHDTPSYYSGKLIGFTKNAEGAREMTINRGMKKQGSGRNARYVQDLVSVPFASTNHVLEGEHKAPRQTHAPEVLDPHAARILRGIRGGVVRWR